MMAPPAFSFTSRAVPVVEVGIGNSSIPTGQALWDQARWDQPQSVWNGDEPVWRDITCDVQAVDGVLGRARITDPFPPGTCDVVVDNASGWADPGVETPGVLSMRPGRPLRVGVTHITLGTRWLFRGWIDRIEPLYDAEEPDLVRFSCIDALGEAGRAKLTAVDATGADETADQRVNRILDLLPWLASKRDIQPTSVELVAAVLEGQVVDMLRRCADSAGGACFGDGDGNVVFRGRDWLYHTETDPLDGTIGNGGDPGEVCPTSWRRPFARSDIATRVILDRMMPPGAIPSEPVEFDDNASQTRYGVEPWERLDLWTRDDTDLNIIGQRTLAQRSAVTMPLVDGVTVDAATSDKVVDLLAGLSIWEPSRYRCRLILPRGQIFDRNYFATGVTFHLDPDAWTADISLDWSDLYSIPVGPHRWDTARWDRALWN